MQNTVGSVSATNVEQMNLIEGGMSRKIDCLSMANKKNGSKTHGRDALKMSVIQLNTFELFTTVNHHQSTIFLSQFALDHT